jgi:predicted ATPase
MSFEVEMIVPPTGRDDLGQEAKAAITFVRYSLDLAYRNLSEDGSFHTSGLEITKEQLIHINKSDARKYLPFQHSASKWRETVVIGRRDNLAPFISTHTEISGNRVIRQHQDGGSRGKPLPRLAANLPRTVLSVANAAETPTALMARREMQSWRLLQLEPSAMRKPSSFNDYAVMGTDGANLPITLYRLAYNSGDPDAVYAQVANRLAELIEDVREVWVDRDEKRQLYVLNVKLADNTWHSARSLSDGTLRFLALVVLELDPEARGVICMEEPENGIHPERIPAMLRLLENIAVDAQTPVDGENPLRQVIINTHSPAVVQQVPDASLLGVQLTEHIQDGQRFKAARFSGLPETWRAALPNAIPLAKGDLLAYLNPAGARMSNGSAGVRRVVDRPDLQPYLPFPDWQAEHE